MFKILTVFMLLSLYSNVKTQLMYLPRPGQNQFSGAPASPVHVEVYYESHCPYCIKFFQGELSTLMKQLGSYVNLYTHPFGHTKVNFANGIVNFESQHGPTEAYGNKLHACAIDCLGSGAAAFEFNACMMGFYSNDTAADQCGGMFNVNPEPIKVCARSSRGDELLYEHGMASAQFPFKVVPAILVNGRPTETGNLFGAVCDAIPNPPPVCHGSL